uniref:Uncharacterized protein n=1 Tax=Vespula pensylvanica TaxID=30213 RepID=A0A834N4A6_VESPE|nr:hypothetical protein H0235_017039 [Vespula pensylvanica]
MSGPYEVATPSSFARIRRHVLLQKSNTILVIPVLLSRIALKTRGTSAFVRTNQSRAKHSRTRRHGIINVWKVAAATTAGAEAIAATATAAIAVAIAVVIAVRPSCDNELVLLPDAMRNEIFVNKLRGQKSTLVRVPNGTIENCSIGCNKV